MAFGVVGSRNWSAACQAGYDKRASHSAVVAVLKRFNEREPGLEEWAERVLVVCSLGFNHYSREDGSFPCPITLMSDLNCGSWLPILLTAIEAEPLLDETQRSVMIGGYMIAESFIFHNALKHELEET